MYQPALKLNKKGVPFLTKPELNKIGEELVLDFCPQNMRAPQEIDMDRFLVNYLGVEQDFQFLSHCGCYLGMTVYNDSDSVPVYDPESGRAYYICVKANTVIIDNSLLKDDQEHRYRFTVGHEASHVILHNKYFSYDPNQLSLFDTKLPMVQCRIFNNKNNQPNKQWNDIEKMEWQANYLSAAILMPEKMVRELLSGIVISCPMQAISLISDCFNVSYEAASYRFEDLFKIQK